MCFFFLSAETCKINISTQQRYAKVYYGVYLYDIVVPVVDVVVAIWLVKLKG